MLPRLDAIMAVFFRLMSRTRLRFILELSLMFVLVWCGCALLIYTFEHGINPRIHDRLDAIYYLLVTMTTSGDSAVTPMTTGGRVVMSFALILSKLLTALLCAVAAAVLIDHKLKVEMGLKMHKLNNHIVIIGWNLKGSQIVSSFRKNPSLQKEEIVVMADIEQKPVDDPLLYFTRSPYPIRGDAIERACLAQARVIVILANYGERQYADALTAVNCMMARKENPEAKVVAELLDPGQRLYLETSGANSVVSIGDVGGFLLAEAVAGSQEAQFLLNAVARRAANG
ncbi:potassium channel family protein [Undibacterium cyanobacteriorum]|uniref:Potassium channel family protein n=1 Tax=Undibacterium cyanobacteriorum TaxID=3073561 RepID=A0ABY9RMF2_9BURK|nr:potassium channel family protein [Undibacterium sp. 20NA77.5]WMW82141.1 potassium channel family protein [Undibacterium sp. 20NA77.5]